MSVGRYAVDISNDPIRLQRDVKRDPLSDLTRLYVETKKSALDNVSKVTRADKEDSTPALSSLHRKFRIQKDRLITWGLEWSDEGKGVDGNIDGAVARAGFTDTVTSVLENIKEVLEQAERIRSASLPQKQTRGGLTPEKSSWLSVDLAEYESLVTQLTESIDILYDLSRNRRALLEGSHPSFAPTTAKSEKSEYFGRGIAQAPTVAPQEYDSSFSAQDFGLPSKIDISALILPEEGPPPYQDAGLPIAISMIGRLLRSQAPEEVRLFLQESFDDPLVLVEYANFDNVYRESQITPPLRRLDALAGYLQHARIRPQMTLLGYFEDPQTARLGLVFDISHCVLKNNPGLDLDSEPIECYSLLHLLQTASKNAKVTESLSATPPLEDRFRLAVRVTEKIEDMHATSFSHGNLNSGSIMFVERQLSPTPGPIKLRTPVLSAFDLFQTQNSAMPDINIYRHPSDQTRDFEHSPGIKFDVYGLGLTLLEIGLWTPLSELYKSKYQLKDFKTRLERIWIPRLSVKCGSLYMSVVRTCFEFADSTSGSDEVASVYDDILAKLRRCSLLCDDTLTDPNPTSPFLVTSPIRDPDSLYTPLSPELRRKDSSHVSGPRGLSPAVITGATDYASTAKSPSTQITRPSSPLHFREYRKRVVLLQNCWRKCMAARRTTQVDSSSKSVQETIHYRHDEGGPDNVGFLTHDASEEHKPKQRAFPVSLPQSIINEWHSSIGVRLSSIVERALKDSVESATIDLVGLGTDEATAKPTILVTCVSTSRVKAAIKKKFQCDPATFDVKVRKGSVALLRRRGCGKASRGGDDGDSADLSALSKRHSTLRRSSARRPKQTSPNDPALSPSSAKLALPPSDSALHPRLSSTLPLASPVMDRPQSVTDSIAESTGMTISSTDDSDLESDDDPTPQNPYYHPRPSCGASIGAYNADEGHLLPVTFGGVVVVDADGERGAETYGMSVHHMLEPESDDDDDDGDDDESVSSAASSGPETFSSDEDEVEHAREAGEGDGRLRRSSARAGTSRTFTVTRGRGDAGRTPSMAGRDSGDEDSSSDVDFSPYPTSAASGSDSESEAESDKGDHEERASLQAGPVASAGDTRAFPANQPSTSQWTITQPSLIDAQRGGWHALDQDQLDTDADHLMSFGLGTLHASSGLRRYRDSDGAVHEVDWALFSIRAERLRDVNLVLGGARHVDQDAAARLRAGQRAQSPVLREAGTGVLLANDTAAADDETLAFPETQDLFPRGVAPRSSYPDASVLCSGRTSGLAAGGVVGAAMSRVKFWGRRSFSVSWTVVGGAFGVGGDSGAWIFDRRGRVVGVVLAEQRGVTYFCPMDVVLADVGRVLGRKVNLAGEVRVGQETMDEVEKGESSAVTARVVLRPAVALESSAARSKLQRRETASASKRAVDTSDVAVA